MASKQAFQPTRPGITELKELPEGQLLQCKGNQSYFESSNQLFRALFQYIQKHDIAMTTPVEAHINPGAMYFWVLGDQEEKPFEQTSQVGVVAVPRRFVASQGARGAYHAENFAKARTNLLKWVNEQPELEVMGEPFAVYWDSPLTPWFLKTFEVQVEVKRKKADSLAAPSLESQT